MKRSPTALAIAAVVLLCTSQASFATPPDDGCPRGFTLWDTATEPYEADNAVDEAGNNNGWVCARLLGPGASRYYDTDLPIYVFLDDTL